MRSITTRHHCSITTLLFFTILSLFTSKFASSLDTLTATQSLVNGQTLISERQSFELGFFTPGNSRNWYVGIWYKSIPRTYVWVANRDNPLTNSSGTFKISNQSIVLYDREENLTWSSNRTSARNPVMQLLDSGNLVLRDQDSDSSQFLWQSFDYPTDTLLPDMKFGWDLNTGLDRYLSSWKSSDDPGTGDFSFKLQYHGFPEAFLSKDKKIQYRSGPWNGQRFSGVPEMEPVDHISFSFITNQDEVYYSFHTSNKSLYSRLTVTSSGFLQRFAWIPETQQWSKFWYAPKDQCDDYRECGPYGICDSNASPVCKCMRGFQPKNVQAWSLRDGSAQPVENTTLKDCEVMCSRNCSCTAYANSNISNGGSGCVFWTGVLFDMRQYPEGGQDLYVRLAASDIGDGGGADTIIIGIAVGISILILALSGFSIWKRKRLLSVCNGNTQQKGPQDRSQDFLLNGVIISKKDFTGDKSTDEFELPLLEFSTIASATNNFADENKLGEGGFGRVHKGRLAEDQEVAVKRLSKNSVQGTVEFKNERTDSIDYPQDLKASNILLDHEWTPKISDFGMARLFGGDQIQANTVRVVGTYGYMSPEYAMDGLFSAKSDVFSFGVLVLEIVCGEKNRGFYRSYSELNLLGHDGRMEVLDSSVGNSYSPCEVLRCIQVGLLCVQERAEDRPTMSSAVLMLSSETATMPHPKTPGYCLGRSPFETDSSSSKQDESFSVNHVTVTVLDASPGSSSNRYLGIWYYKVPEKTVVWVANRNDPIIGSSGFLFINQYGNLVLYGHDDQKLPVWSTNVSVEENDSCEAQLLDSGNLIIVTKRSRSIVWQSFDHPTNTLLPGMKIGLDQKLGIDWLLTSWRSADDPGIGEFSNVTDDSYLLRIIADHSGHAKALTWRESDGQWKEYWKTPQFQCDYYALCGAYSTCEYANLNEFVCACLPGFEPKYPEQWSARDGSGGCVRKRQHTSSVCDDGEGFLKMENYCLPDTSNAELRVAQTGLLANGQEVAVKRLSRSSGQGTEEFKNEVMVIAKLQHRNLVKLLGYCIQNECFIIETKLDSFLFDETRRLVLDWPKRFGIIVGIARGILYLHQDSRLRIVHRDLKCSNILLDAELNPKISDFGIAKIFEGNQTEDRTRRVVGTYGYMSPEYVVWELWGQEKALEIVDPSLKELYHPHEALKCIRIGLLCVEEDAMNRPSMLAVVFMLSNETEIPSPKQPAFLFRESRNNPDIALAVEDGVCSEIRKLLVAEAALSE
uniref:non-specific serine/threonine protein kinase n=1 Tax=Salix viminalis TaxID=40686 RepID=A0A6N2M4Q4_SALVM